YSEPLESDEPNEVEKIGEYLVGFTGKSNDERRTQRDARDSSAQSLNQIFDMLTRRFPSHASQHRVVDMLQGNIDVARNFVASRNGFNEFIAPMCRVRIKEAHPEVALDFLDFAQKTGEGWAACRVHWLTRPGLRRPEIHPIIGRVLADQIDLPNAFANESPNFG